MTLIAFVGAMGSGKTLSMIALAYTKHLEGKKILTNMSGLTFPHEVIDKKKILAYTKENTTLSNCVLLLDEVHTLIDSRRAVSGSNLVWSYMILQSRKRNVDIYWTSQDFGQADIRLRRQTDITISCRSRKEINKAGEEIVLIYQTIYAPAMVTDRVIIGNPVFPLYDTSEVINFGE